MKIIKKFIFFVFLCLLYFIARELIEIYVLARSVHPLAGYVVLAVIAMVFVYFVLLPIYQIIRIPAHKGPTTDKTKEVQIIDRRIVQFKTNSFLKSIQFDFSIQEDEKQLYDEIIKTLEIECDIIRRKYVSQLFYTSSISQNGFIDAILILSSSVSLIKQIFVLYNGRVSNKDLITIGKKVYYSMAIGGSEGVEYAAEEIFSKIASDSVKSIPFIEKILGSLTDGFVNAVLLNRISYITENYCKLAYIQSERDFYPSPKFIATATKNITSDIIDRLATAMKKLAFDKPLDFAMMAVNPLRYFFLRTFDKSTPQEEQEISWLKATVKDSLAWISSPFSYVFGKLFGVFNKK